MIDDTDAELAALPRPELVERARALQTVLRVARATARARSVEELAERFVEAVSAYTRFPAVVVLRFLPAQETFELVAQRGFDESKFPPRKALPARGSLSGLAAERRQILTTEDIAQDDRLDPETRAALLANAYTSGACVPLIHSDEVVGSFNLIYPRGTTLGAPERRLIGALGEALGVALAQQGAAERERDLEAQARRAQQLDSLGVLAGGIAHDFNNLLTGIVGNIDLARTVSKRAGNDDLGELLDQALDASSRATALVKQLLTFSRGGAPARRAVADLGTVVREVASFAARGTSVRCAIEVEEPLGTVHVDVGQVGQVVQNLVLNACQASASGATVTVRVRREARGEGARVLIEVIDTGRGIAPEHLPRIFDPFFTARSGGTGLGLAVSHSIVHRHGGHIRVRSELGHGTTVTVDLPTIDGAPAVERSAPSSLPHFSGRVLVMDDENAVRRVTHALLTRLGFLVDTAADGAAALEAARRATAECNPFRLAVLDLTVVGGLGAAEISEELRGASPGIRLVLATGYARDDARAGWDAVVQKPYTIAELARALEQALGSLPSAAVRT
jgi:signal transduction histidine kinase/CheY-like chemotaxis protein